MTNGGMDCRGRCGGLAMTFLGAGSSQRQRNKAAINRVLHFAVISDRIIK